MMFCAYESVQSDLVIEKKAIKPFVYLTPLNNKNRDLFTFRCDYHKLPSISLDKGVFSGCSLGRPRLTFPLLALSSTLTDVEDCKSVNVYGW